MLLKGGHVKALQARLGHSSIKTTLDVYGHYVEGMDDAAAKAIDAALRDIIYNP